MNDSLRVLIVGGGFSGMSAAIRMARHGMYVDLVERDPTWGANGAGISLSGPTLRALGELDLLDAVLEYGFCESGCVIRHADGRVLQSIETPSPAPGVPGGGAIMRPMLARIMADATRAAGVNIHLGTTWSHLDNTDTGVSVSLTDARRATYDLVVGADGLSSDTRALFWPGVAGPNYTGQGVWRATVPRPSDIECVTMYRGAHCKAGVNPVSDESMYLFLVENRPQKTFVADAQAIDALSRLLSEFTAPALVAARRSLGADSDVSYRPLESILLQRPWFDRRVVLLGDAVHATTPHLASGAGLGIEAGLVLADELAARGDGSITDALHRYQERRWERSRMVVENSLRLGKLEQVQGCEREHGEIISQSMRALAEAI